LLDHISGYDDDEFFYADVLNQIPCEDRRWILLLAAEQLLGENPTIKHRAWNEAIIWEIYERMKGDIETGVEMQMDREKGRHPFFLRRMVAEALKEAATDVHPTEKPLIPRSRSTNVDEWELAVEWLFDEFELGTDFLSYEQIADMDPEMIASRMKIMGIPEDYFLEVPPLLTQDVKVRLEKLHTKLSSEDVGIYKEFIKSGKLKFVS